MNPIRIGLLFIPLCLTVIIWIFKGAFFMNESRIERVLENMQKYGLEQAVITSTSSVYYLTGIWVEPLERMLALYLNTRGDRVLFGNYLFGLPEQEGAKLLQHSDSDNPVQDLAQTVLPGKLGIDKMWPSKFLIGLTQLRPDIVPVLGSAPVDDARMLKDAQEIEAMRYSSRINDQAVEAAISLVCEGVRETDLTTKVEEFYRNHGADHSSEGQLVCFGKNGSDPHHAANDTVIQEGDSVTFDIFIPFHRYWCDMTRTVFFKKVSEEQRRVYETVKKANLSAIASVRPGVALREFDRAARSVIEDAGYGPFFTHRLGHGAGLDCHEMPDVSSSSETIAKPGMVFSIEPGIYLPGKFGVRIEDLVLVTEDGCEVLNNASKELRIV